MLEDSWCGIRNSSLTQDQIHPDIHGFVTTTAASPSDQRIIDE
jgi:hypothetical protein